MSTLLTLTLALGVASTALAQKKKKKKGDKGSEEKYTPPYGMAGCGLGSIIFKENTMFPQVMAATSNGIGFQTSAISSSHSSGCAPTKADVAREEQEVFLSANLRALEEDVTSGGGQYSRAFAEVLGCTDDGEYAEFLETSRSNYETIFAGTDTKVIHARYLQAINANPRLLQVCERVAILGT